MLELEAVFSEIERKFEAGLNTFNAPGIVVCFTSREQLLRVSTFGYADMATGAILTPDTSFPIGSISKSFASVAVLALREQGALDLDTPVVEYLPWLELPSDFEPISLHNLMSQTAGLPTGSDATTSPYSEAWALRRLRLSTPPGTHFHYSNTGYKIVGLVLERVTGGPVDEALRSWVLEPLQMLNTDPALTYEARTRCAIGYQPFYDDRPIGVHGILAPAPWILANSADGSIASTAKDMAKYMRMLLNNGRGVLSDAAFSSLTEPIIAVDDAMHGECYAYGLAASRISGRTRLGHGGATVGFRAHMLVDMDDGFGVTILANGPWDPEPWAIYALDMLGAALRGEEADTSSPTDRMSVEDALQYTGQYAAQEDAFSIICEEGRPYFSKEGLCIPLEAKGGDVFYVDHPAYARFCLHFGRQEGAVVEAHQGSHWYTNDRYTGPRSFDYPAAWDAYCGKYASHNPWFPSFRIVVYKGSLIMIEPSGDETPMVQLSPREFRVGEDARSPERLRFDMFINGRPHKVELSGEPYHRSFTP
jgi:D-alanyl-D-alanine carboxypeptidase